MGEEQITKAERKLLARLTAKAEWEEVGSVASRNVIVHAPEGDVATVYLLNPDLRPEAAPV